MPWYTLGNKKGQSLTVKAATSDDAKRKALAAGLEPDILPSWTGREKRDYTILARSNTDPDKKANPGFLKCKGVRIKNGKLQILR